MHAKSYVVEAQDSEHKIDTITFGPLSVLPQFQKKGVGSALISHSIEQARRMNHKAIIILGHPHNYCKHGFKNSKDFGISNAEGKYPYGQLALELEKNVFKGYNWKFHSAPVYEFSRKAAEEFDKGFADKKKEHTHTQEEFSIAVRAYII
jgi:predicted N-acetyltransferase YhbS